MDITHFDQLHQSGTAALASTRSDTELKLELELCLAESMDWSTWARLLGARGRDERVILWAARELRFGAYLASIGHYRSAFAQIRLFLELGVSSIEFSANEVYCRKWHAGNRNMKWSVLIDEKTGVYSQDFCKVFFLELAGEVNTYRGLLDSVYSDCSAFVHGEAETHGNVDAIGGFNQDLSRKWIELRNSAHLGLLFGFVMRFSRELSEAERMDVAPCVLKHLSQLDQVKDLFPIGVRA